MKKSRDAITIFHDKNSDNSEDETAAVSPISKSSTDTATDHALNNQQQRDTTPIKLTPLGAVQLTSSKSPPPSTNNNATTNAILSLKTNPFYHDKRKWDESFTVAEKKELTGNIVKAAKDNDGETYVTLQEEEYTVTNLSHEEDDSQESDDVDSAIGKKPGRKPMADEDALSDSDQDPKVKRKAQNRAAQRAFRERKERYVKELEAKIKQVQDSHLVATAQLVRENHQLRSIIYRLEAENYALKGIPMQPYQHQTTLSPHQPPLQQQQRPNSNGTSNYTSIAPLLPHTPQQQQQPLLLPAYLSNTTSASPASSILPPNSSSVNHMMMLASSPLQQYPMSPVVSTTMVNNSLNSSPSPTLSNNNSNHKIAMPKKVSSKKNNHHNTSTPPPNNQPLEYTFSISTPASLRPSGGSVSSSKHARSEPVELVQLYPPGGSRNQANNNNTNGTSKSTLQKSDLIMLSPSSNNNGYVKKAHSVTSVSSQGSNNNNTVNTVTTPGSTSGLHHNFADDNSSIMSDKTSSTVNTQQQRKKMQQLELDMFDCHIDTEGQLFCEKLHNEVCNDAFDRLLSEPLFDQMGKLNLSINAYPVPIVTGHMSLSLDDEKNNSDEEEHTSGDEDNQDNNNNNKENDNPVISSEKEEKKSAISKQKKSIKENTKGEALSPSSPATTNNTTKSASEQKRLLTCPEIWFLLNQHEKFSNFTTDQLCQAVKELAKCADSGPVLEEADLYQIMSKMNQGYF